MKLNLIRYRFVKCIVVFLYPLFFTTLLLPAQDTIPKIKIYKVWVKSINEYYKSEGVLYQLKDSSILISNSLAKYNYYTNNFEVRELNIKSIEKLSLRRKGGVGKGAWIGALSGFFVGLIVGIAASPDTGDSYGNAASSGAYGIAGGFAGALYGAGLGALAGLIKLSIPIDGQVNNYYKGYSKLEKRAIKKSKRK